MWYSFQAVSFGKVEYNIIGDISTTIERIDRYDCKE